MKIILFIMLTLILNPANATSDLCKQFEQQCLGNRQIAIVGAEARIADLKYMHCINESESDCSIAYNEYARLSNKEMFETCNKCMGATSLFKSCTRFSQKVCMPEMPLVKVPVIYSSTVLTFKQQGNTSIFQGKEKMLYENDRPIRKVHIFDMEGYLSHMKQPNWITLMILRTPTSAGIKSFTVTQHSDTKCTVTGGKQSCPGLFKGAATPENSDNMHRFTIFFSESGQTNYLIKADDIKFIIKDGKLMVSVQNALTESYTSVENPKDMTPKKLSLEEFEKEWKQAFSKIPPNGHISFFDQDHQKWIEIPVEIQTMKHTGTSLEFEVTRLQIKTEGDAKEHSDESLAELTVPYNALKKADIQVFVDSTPSTGSGPWPN